MIVSIRPIQDHHIESIGKIQQFMVVETTGLHINTIKGTYCLKLELSVGVLVVRDFVDDGRRCQRLIYSYATILPRLQRLPNTVILYIDCGMAQRTRGKCSFRYLLPMTLTKFTNPTASERAR